MIRLRLLGRTVGFQPNREAQRCRRRGRRSSCSEGEERSNITGYRSRERRKDEIRILADPTHFRHTRP
jgi:hypothetical protein